MSGRGATKRSGGEDAARSRPLTVRLIEGALVALMGLHVLALLVPVLGPVAERVQAVLLVCFVPLALMQARRPTLILTALVTVAATALWIRYRDFESLQRGLRSATIFAAFLPLLQFLRVFAVESDVVKEVRQRFTGLSPRQARCGFAVGAFGVGSFLSTGAHALLGPLVPRDASEHARRAAALAAIRGISLAAIWSPFFLQVAFVTRSMPDVAPLSLLALGLSWGLVALAAELAFAGVAVADTSRILHGLRPLALPAAIAASLLLSVMFALGWSPLQTLVVVLPLAGLWRVVFGRQRERARAALKAGYETVARVSDEVLIVTGASIFSAMLAASSSELVALAPALVALPGLVLLSCVMALMLLAGMLGIHPSIAAAAMIGVFAGLPDTVSRLALALTLLVGWALAAVISPVSLNALVAGQMFRVPYQTLVFSRNIAYALTLGATTVIVLWALAI